MRGDIAVLFLVPFAEKKTCNINYSHHLRSGLKNSVSGNIVNKNCEDFRSKCPLNVAIEMFGDKWTLLIVRDLFFFSVRTFNQLLEIDESISTGTLTTRIQKLQENGIIDRQQSETDRRSVNYRLTEVGRGLEPIMVEMVLWVADYNLADLPEESVAMLRAEKTFKNVCTDEAVEDKDAA